jgi:hypothetical protein
MSSSDAANESASAFVRMRSTCAAVPSDLNGFDRALASLTGMRGMLIPPIRGEFRPGQIICLPGLQRRDKTESLELFMFDPWH